MVGPGSVAMKLRFVACALSAVLCSPAMAQDRPTSAAESVTLTLTTALVPSPVEVGVLLPPGYERSKPIPVLLFLQNPVVLFG